MEKDAEILNDQEIDFCTLGMFIIDEIHYPPPKPPISDILGGAGTFAALGARLFSPAPLSKRISWIVDAGSDFPPSLIPLIHSWDTSVLLRNNSSRLTTRGWNGYDSAENRDFKYLTPKLRLEVSDLESQPALLNSKSFHLICSPLRCVSLVTNLLHARKRLYPHAPKPIIVWEPAPDSCVPSQLLNLTNCLPYIDIFSPNCNELLNFFSEPLSVDANSNHNSDNFDTAPIEAACEQLLAAMPLQTYAIVIRCGAHGAYIAKNGGRSRRPSRRPSPSGRTRQKRPANHARGGLTLDTDIEALFAGFDADFDRGPLPIDPGTSLWLPAYFKTCEENVVESLGKPTFKKIELGKLDNQVITPVRINNSMSTICEQPPFINESSRVLDPTGAGNSFLGALTVALARAKSLEEAVCWGSVAASFIVEQIGVPVCSKSIASEQEIYEDDGNNNLSNRTHDQEERWNGDSVLERLDDFLERVQCIRTRG